MSASLDKPIQESGERVLATFRPSWWSVPLRVLPWLVALACVCVLVWWVVGRLPWYATDESAGNVWWRVTWPVWAASLAILMLILARSVLAVVCSRYTLTDRRALARHGWLSRAVVEVNLERVQDIAVTQTFGQRLLGLGNVGVATASGGYALVWAMIGVPHERLVMLRCVGKVDPAGTSNERGAHAMSELSLNSKLATKPDERGGSGGRRPPFIIGLAGGIGSGKSHVAKVFAGLGSPRCMVIDSDRLAREALDRPEVRAQLVQWWGEGVLRDASDTGTSATGGSGREAGSRVIDRAKVAAIVFDKPQERQRLEGLIHPLIRQSREEMIASALKTEAPPEFVLVDAPLLFETGLDRECDAVVFVDAPRSVRLDRVRSTRGWSEAELARREASQWSVDEKRSKAAHVVDNGPNAPDLREQARSILRMIGEQAGEIRRSSPQTPTPTSRRDQPDASAK